MIVTVLGKMYKENHLNKRTGVVSPLSLLHVVHEKPLQPVEGFEGQKVETFFPPFDVRPIPLGAKINLEFEISNGRAYLCGYRKL